MIKQFVTKCPFIVVLLAVNAAAISSTCTNMYGPIVYKITHEQYAVHSSDLIFIGEARTVEKTILDSKGSETFIRSQIAVFEDIDFVKGNASAPLIIENNKDSNCQCTYPYQVGVKYVVFASRDSKKENRFITHHCSQIRPYYSLPDELEEKSTLTKLVKETEEIMKGKTNRGTN